jgi:leucyl aminopeptidase
MNFSCSVSNFFDIEDTAAVLFCEKGKLPTGNTLEKIDLLTDGAVTEMYKTGEFDGSPGTEIMLRRVPETAADRIILSGIGKTDEATTETYRRAVGRIGKLALRHKLKSVSFYYNGRDTNPIASAIVEGFVLGSYRFLDYKTKDDDKDEIEGLTLVVPQRGKLRQAEVGAARGEIISDGVCHCRDLVATPGNDLYPESFAKHAQKLAKTFKFDCKVLGPADIRKEKMGALYAVGKGSEKLPRFVILKYNGNPKSKAKPVVLIGKGITFDSGGISLKPGLAMDEMKGDMTGAAVVMMALTTAARLEARVNLVALMPLAENMPSGVATRPGDIVTTRAGHTVEIINTDAEGRLILADALDYATTFDPQAVIDIATLTGAAVYILGYSGAPIAGNNPRLNDNLRAASNRTGERIWELPLWDDFADLMKSQIADIKNSAGKTAGTLAAASFLKKFIGDWPWTHIDIAYCDLEPKGQPYVPKGPTGFGVRLLVDLISHWKKV